MKGTKIFIDPRSRLVFASQYIYGLGKVFGDNNLRFRMKPFVDLEQKGDAEAFDHYMALLVVKGDKKTRVVIDFRDKNTLNLRAYEWCHIYGKLNLNTGLTEKKYLEKCISIGPMVAPKIWGFTKTTLVFLLNYIRCHRYISVSMKRFMQGYRWQLQRPKLNEYCHQQPDDSYIFFDSTLWTREAGSEETNEWRANFIRTCKSLDVEFQGGLYPNAEYLDSEKYKDILLTKFANQSDYINRIKRSTLVFNTPSVHSGHGWKLGEFLAMGKAMVSSTLINDMPVPLEHGKNIHIIKERSEMQEGIEKILNDRAYREKLEQGALEYYRTYLEPEPLIRRLLKDLLD